MADGRSAGGGEAWRTILGEFVIELVLPYPVSANVYWVSFLIHKRIMTAPSGEAKKYKRHVAKIAQAAGIREPMHGRIHVDLELYPNRPQDWKRRAQKNPLNWDDDVRCIDIDNARKCLYDAMKNVVFDDDKWVWSDTAKRMEPDGRDACVVVRITPIQAPAILPELPLDLPLPARKDFEMDAKPF